MAGARASSKRGRTGRGARPRRPLYQRTALHLGEVLARTPPGNYLPSEPALARRMGVSRATLREAMRGFEEQGIIVRRQGIGTYVARPPKVIPTGLEVLESIATLARRIGLEVEVADVHIEERPAQGHEADGLSLGPDEPVVRVSRVIQSDGRPVAFLVDVLPSHVLPPEALTGGFRGSVLDLLLTRGRPQLDHSRTEISALAAPPELARRLQIQRGDCLLRLEGVLFSAEGEAVDRSQSYFLPGPFQFHVVRRVGRTPPRQA